MYESQKSAYEHAESNEVTIDRNGLLETTRQENRDEENKEYYIQEHSGSRGHCFRHNRTQNTLVQSSHKNERKHLQSNGRKRRERLVSSG